MFSRGFLRSGGGGRDATPCVNERKKKLHKTAPPTFFESLNFVLKVVGSLRSRAGIYGSTIIPYRIRSRLPRCGPRGSQGGVGDSSRRLD